MPKLHDEKPCPKCAGTMVWDIERKPDGEPMRKRWKCQDCGHVDEWSYRMNEPL